MSIINERLDEQLKTMERFIKSPYIGLWIGLLDSNGKEPDDPSYNRLHVDKTGDFVFGPATCEWTVCALGIFRGRFSKDPIDVEGKPSQIVRYGEDMNVHIPKMEFTTA